MLPAVAKQARHRSMDIPTIEWHRGKSDMKSKVSRPFDKVGEREKSISAAMQIGVIKHETSPQRWWLPPRTIHYLPKEMENRKKLDELVGAEKVKRILAISQNG